MKLLKPLSITVIAILINVLIFLLVPLLQVLFSDPPVKDRDKNKIEQELVIVVQKKIEETVKKEIKPIRTFSRKFKPSTSGHPHRCSHRHGKSFLGRNCHEGTKSVRDRETLQQTPDSRHRSRTFRRL